MFLYMLDSSSTWRILGSRQNGFRSANNVNAIIGTLEVAVCMLASGAVHTSTTPFHNPMFEESTNSATGSQRVEPPLTS